MLFSRSTACRHNICEVVWFLPLLLVEAKFSVFSSINVVYCVCLHGTLQASFEQFILYVRVLLFIFISFIFSCMIVRKLLEINVVLNACHNNY